MKQYNFSGQAMGTTYNVVIVTEEQVDRDYVEKVLDDSFDQINAHLSNWDEKSEISRFNALEGSDPVKISPMLRQVIEGANIVHRQSGGAFDITIGPVVDLWGFGAGTGDFAVPSDTDLRAALSKVGQGDKLQLGEGALRKIDPNVEVNLSGIAKGFGVDVLAQSISRLGFENFMIEVGGDLSAKGVNIRGDRWRIGVEKPDTAGKQVGHIVNISDRAMATSGDYRNYFKKDGVRYSHLINPTSGRPVVHDTVSVTIVAKNAMTADAWATALIVLGREKGIAVAEENDIAALFIFHQEDDSMPRFRTLMSSAFQDLD